MKPKIASIVLLGLLLSAVPAPATKSAGGITVTAWMHQNDWQLAISSLAKNASLIQVASPAWYRPTPDGGVQAIEGARAGDQKLIALCRTRHILLRPLLMNTVGSKFDPSLVRPILADGALRSRHIQNIVALVSENGYDGIDLDYEGLSAAELPQFANLVTELAAALHAEGKTLAVTAQPKLFNDATAEPWAEIGEAADAVELMVYPEHSSSTSPGPIATLGWVRESVTKALTVIPKEKLVLGIAVYAITWGARKVSGSWATLVEPFLRREAKASRDFRNDAPWFLDGGMEIWYEDATSVASKLKIARSLGVSHFAIWRIGGEDPAIWSEIKKQAAQ